MSPPTTYGSITVGGGEERNPTSRVDRPSWRKQLLLVFSFAIFVAVVFLAFTSDSGDPSPANNLMRVTTHQPAQSEPEIPFEAVDRAKYGSIPADNIVDPHLFDPSLRGSSSSRGGLLSVPFPTGAFWTNLVLLQQTSDRGLSYPIMVYPYGYKWSPDMLQISYPPLRRMQDGISIRDIFNPDLTASMLEKTTDRHVMRWDPLSVTLRYYPKNVKSSGDSSSSSSENDKDKYWETYLVQGSPYLTFAYKDVTPVITPLSIFKGFTCPTSTEKDDNNDNSDDCSVVHQDDTTVTLKGTRFLLHTQENLTWMLFASKEGIVLSFDNIRKTTITSVQTFSGVLRLALVPPTISLQSSTDISDLSPTSIGVKNLLACHSNTYPVGGKVTWNVPTKGVANVHFRYTTTTLKSDSDCHSNELLMLALPHHMQVLPAEQLLSDSNLVFRTIKGSMVPVLGETWSYQEPLTEIGFESSSSLKNAGALNDYTRKIILDQVRKDMYVVLPTLDENVYGFGKQVARLAQLAHITSVLDDKRTEEEPSLTEQISRTLYEYLSAYLTGNNKDKLLFDINFGGIVSKDGLENSGGDFGNGWYNDHLFHYGYILYASAVLGKLNASFVEQHGSAVDALAFDVTYSGNADSASDLDAFFLPFARHKSWYDSHSFASGLFPFADGKSMESSAESVNCYYGSYLWSLVRWGSDSASPNQDNVDYARLLLAMEIRGVKTYWHMVPPEAEWDTFHESNIYDAKFAKSLMVGNVGMMDVTIATWFGTNPLYVHMINFLPITAISRVLFEKSYVEKEFKEIIEPVYSTVEMAWRGYVICDRAMIDPTSAWDDALELRSYELDQAISQSQVLYFASTTDGFVPPAPPSSEATTSSSDSGDDGQQSSAAFCSEHKACLELGLVGDCCPPTPNGVNLGCCGVVAISDTPIAPQATSTNSEALCTDNKACADLGLTGNCCPSDGGAFLGCCDS